ncbi:uncharacterized protein RCC_07945 [Ramularia collo-cygni]|uniref:Uncharacterized protein n=1 Tax=Ramularia collo-cygni TaxID=112498 RepID=A0A2D3VBA3_9PEZI|nr:uncharacterized protein RCC_07945 [Ramularia collo-cygni]CZT22077.1 uncharacterized protein RCC_07945 [Ramularia collo-cygni]
MVLLLPVAPDSTPRCGLPVGQTGTTDSFMARLNGYSVHPSYCSRLHPSNQFPTPPSSPLTNALVERDEPPPSLLVPPVPALYPSLVRSLLELLPASASSCMTCPLL